MIPDQMDMYRLPFCRLVCIHKAEIQLGGIDPPSILKLCFGILLFHFLDTDMVLCKSRIDDLIDIIDLHEIIIHFIRIMFLDQLRQLFRYFDQFLLKIQHMSFFHPVYPPINIPVRYDPLNTFVSVSRTES